MAKLLIVDDEKNIRQSLTHFLSGADTRFLLPRAAAKLSNSLPMDKNSTWF